MISLLLNRREINPFFEIYVELVLILLIGSSGVLKQSVGVMAITIKNMVGLVCNPVANL